MKSTNQNIYPQKNCIRKKCGIVYIMMYEKDIFTSGKEQDKDGRHRKNAG